MTTSAHMRRVRQTAFAHTFDEPPAPPVCPIDGLCNCPTCGVASAMLNGRLRALGFGPEAQDRVAIRGDDFRGGHACLARVSVRTDTGEREVARLDTVQDILRPDILHDIVKALELLC